MAKNAADRLGNNYKMGFFTTGDQRVMLTPSQLFIDTFDNSIDTVSRWNSTNGGTGIGAVTTAGATLMVGGTTLNSYSSLISQPTFQPTEPGYIYLTERINLEFPLLTTGYRFWGLGIQPATPTIAAPITEGVGFDIDTTGKMYAVTWQTGVRIIIQDLSITGNGTQPLDTAAHKYYVHFRGDQVFWSIDDPENIVANVATGANGPNKNILNIVNLCVSNTGNSPNLIIDGVALGDTAHNNFTLSDPTFGWRRLNVSSDNSISTKNVGSFQNTYSASFNVATAAAATDIALIGGSATKAIYITRVILSGTQTTAGLNDVLLVKRSTADTGGTSTAQTAVPHDSNDVAATATVLAYTANPAALGTAVGTVRRGYLPIAGATSVVNPIVLFDFGDKGQPMTLRGVAQQLAVNLNGATLTGGAFDINFEWYEI